MILKKYLFAIIWTDIDCDMIGCICLVICVIQYSRCVMVCVFYCVLYCVLRF